MINNSHKTKPAYKAVSNLKEKKELRKQLRNNATPAEKKLWTALQGKKLDGDSHYTPEAIEYDHIRDNYLESIGITVILYPNQEIYDDLE